MDWTAEAFLKHYVAHLTEAQQFASIAAEAADDGRHSDAEGYYALAQTHAAIAAALAPVVAAQLKQ